MWKFTLKLGTFYVWRSLTITRDLTDMHDWTEQKWLLDYDRGTQGISRGASLWQVNKVPAYGSYTFQGPETKNRIYLLFTENYSRPFANYK